MSLPLSGKVVLVTRPALQAAEFANPLTALGAHVVLMPAIEIAAPLDTRPLDSALRTIGAFDVVVFTSVNGVLAVRRRMEELGIPDAALSGRHLVVIGPATGAALTAWLRAPDLTPTEFVSEAIAEALGDVNGLKILLPRADLARRDLARSLASSGARVTEVCAYRIVRSESPLNLPETAPDVITVTSAEAARATAARLEQAGKGHWMAESKLVCIGPITAEAIVQMGLAPAATAEIYTIPGLIEALLDCLGCSEATHA